MGGGLGEGWLEIAPDSGSADDGKRNEMEMNVVFLRAGGQMGRESERGGTRQMCFEKDPADFLVKRLLGTSLTRELLVTGISADGFLNKG